MMGNSRSTAPVQRRSSRLTKAERIALERQISSEHSVMAIQTRPLTCSNLCEHTWNEPGMLGLQLLPVSDGLGACVTAVTLADSPIQPGMVITEIGGRGMLREPHEAILEALTRAHRPLRLTFSSPVPESTGMISQVPLRTVLHSSLVTGWAVGR